jgi:hypothetical protein
MLESAQRANTISLREVVEEEGRKEEREGEKEEG